MTTRLQRFLQESDLEEVYSNLEDHRLIQTPPTVDVEKLSNLEGHELVELVRLYVKENGDLRKENIELYTSREMLQRDHELVCRENEKLLKKLEEVNSSPIIPARSAFSADTLNISSDSINDPSLANVWISSDPSKSTTDGPGKEIPEFIQKEMDKRLGSRGKEVNLSTKGRPSSWEDKPNPPKIVRIRSSYSDDAKESSPKLTKQMSLDSNLAENRRFSVAKPKEKKKDEFFGSVISFTDEEDS